VVVIFIVGVMQHGIPEDLFHSGHGTDIAGYALGHLGLLIALQAQQMAHLERLSGIADEKLTVWGDGALVHPEQAKFPPERVVADLEYVAHYVGRRIGYDVYRFGIVPFALAKMGWIAFRRVGHQSHKRLQQLIDTGPRGGGNETDWDQVSLPQGLFERIMQLLRL